MNRSALSEDDASLVDSLYNELVEIITDYQYEYQELPAIQYLEQNLNNPKQAIDIHQLFDEYVDRIKVTNDLSPNTVAYDNNCGTSR